MRVGRHDFGVVRLELVFNFRREPNQENAKILGIDLRDFVRVESFSLALEHLGTHQILATGQRLVLGFLFG